MEDSRHSGGGSCPYQYDRWLRNVMLAKHSIGVLTEGAWQPPTDVYQTKDAIIVRMEIPGIDPDALDIRLSDDVLTVEGVREDCCKHHKVAAQQIEIHYGRFKRAIPLRHSVVHEEVKAEYKSGFLNIEMPKAKQDRATSALFIRISL